MSGEEVYFDKDTYGLEKDSRRADGSQPNSRDGVLIETKSVKGDRAPSSEEKDQMQDYERILNSNKNSHKKIKYYFNTEEAANKWNASIKEHLKGLAEEYIGRKRLYVV